MVCRRPHTCILTLYISSICNNTICYYGRTGDIFAPYFLFPANKSFSSAKTYKQYRGMIVTWDTERQITEDRITIDVVPVWKWLLQ